MILASLALVFGTFSCAHHQCKGEKPCAECASGKDCKDCKDAKAASGCADCKK